MATTSNAKPRTKKTTRKTTSTKSTVNAATANTAPASQPVQAKSGDLGTFLKSPAGIILIIVAVLVLCCACCVGFSIIGNMMNAGSYYNYRY